MTRKSSVLKKVTPNEKVILYLRCRDYASVSEPIDGVVSTDKSYLKGRKIFGQLVGHFRYGLEKDEIMGLKFYRDFILESKQIYPSPSDDNELTEIQKVLKENLSDQLVCPFVFWFPTEAPLTVSLFSKSEVNPKNTCGIHYYVKIWVGESETDVPQRRSTACLNIKRIQYAPPALFDDPPSRISESNFIICSGNIELESTLDKSIFQTNEDIAVNISVLNSSNKIVKKIRATLYQIVSIQMMQLGEYKRVISERVTKKGCPLQPGCSLQTIMHVIPSLNDQRLREGVALNGHHKRQEYDLAYSSYVHNRPVKDAFGIVVSYFIRVKLHFGKLSGQLYVDLPVVLMPLKSDQEVINTVM